MNNILNKVLETCSVVVNKSKHVKINYEKTNDLIDELLMFDNVHYLTKVPYKIYEMSTQDIINFLLIYDAIDFSFWGDPKWTINRNEKELDGGIALLDCIFKLFENKNSIEVYKKIEEMNLEDFKKLLKGNVEIPLLKERYEIITSIAKHVNINMSGNFYEYIKNMNKDIDIFNTIINNFPSFKDTRVYEDKEIYFYKLAQLLTSDILHVINIKEHKNISYENLIGCADYKIPQVLQAFDILSYDPELTNIINSKTEIKENSVYEVEIRANMIMVIDYIYNKIDKRISRIDINDFIWSKGQDKTKKYQPYHLTRTTNY